MQQISIKLNSPQANNSTRPGQETRVPWFTGLRRWLNTVLQEQRALDDQVTAPLLRRYRQSRSGKGGHQIP